MSVNVAFVDKVQNVENVDIVFMIEGVRRSVEEKGYRLVLPKNMGGENGISNELITRAFIAKNIETDNIKFTNFAPHSHSFDLESAHSRAYDNLDIYSIRPWQPSEGMELEARDITTLWQISEVNLSQLTQSSIALKDGSIEDRIRYIESMVVLEKAGLKGDHHFADTLARWLRDSDTDFHLRKHVLLFEWITNEKPLTHLLTHFEAPERALILQNLVDTPRYKRKIAKDRARLLQLAISVKNVKAVRELLLSEFFLAHPERNEVLALSFQSFGHPGYCR